MKQKVRNICENRESVALPTLIELTDGSPGKVFLAVRQLYHEGVLTRVAPGCYQLTTDVDPDDAKFEWDPELES